MQRSGPHDQLLISLACPTILAPMSKHNQHIAVAIKRDSNLWHDAVKNGVPPTKVK